jgi:hypothetical protein
VSFELAAKVADAVLFEGYLLYPYRASAQKNQLRWQFGVLMPPGYDAEPSTAQIECLVEPGAQSVLHVRLRCLQIQPAVHADRGEIRELDISAPLSEGETRVPFSFGGESAEVIRITGVIRITCDRVDGPYALQRVCVRVENTTAASASTSREVALRHALVSTHLLLGVTDGAFISAIDPPEWATAAAQQCQNERLWPVLVGDPARRDVMLGAPIILYDYPQVAPESPGDLFDATEIDEILTLRTAALTDAEKQEARATDPRAAALIDRVEDMPPEILERLHGAIRYVRAAEEPRREPWWDPAADSSVSPDTDMLMLGSTPVAKGSRVRLAPGARRADAQDMFLAGRVAHVEGVFLDVDDQRYLAVTLEDDPAADLYQSHGRFLYFRPDEVEPL